MKIWVACPDFVSGPHRSREIAQRHIDGFGVTCRYRHEIVESETKPLTRLEIEARSQPDAEWPYE